jgi:succinate-semialdehyde dehydrogenase/glutarate-semialdehyde dehydrogenase
MAFTIRVPQGFICGITAFNPRNMVAHKIAPAQGAGNTVFIKLSQATPFCAAILFEILLDAGLPPEHASLVQEDGAEVLGYLVNYRRIAVYSFTGSTSVGRHIRAQVGIRPSTLELGSIAATVVYEDAYLERAAPRIVNAGSRWADQFCNSTQSLFVHEQVVQRFTQLLIDAMQKLPVGDPHNPDIVVASMICVQEAERAERWTNEAVAQGAHFLFGGKRLGSLLLLTILANITSEMKVMCEELFAPVLSLISYHDFKGVIDEANSRPFGLAARIVTRDIDRAMLAARRFYVRAVHINEASASRVDMIAFAGIKNSGMGRESPKCAMQEMTEERLVTISLS